METIQRLERAINFSVWLRDSMFSLMDEFEKGLSGKINDELTTVLSQLKREEAKATRIEVKSGSKK